MQTRHLDRQLYFKEQSISTKKFVLPYITSNYNQQKKPSGHYRVLEIGCGEGGNLKPFLESGYECWGVELTKTSYDNALEFYADHPLKENLTILHKDIYEVTLNEVKGAFDIIFLKDVIEHIPQQENFMKHLKQFISTDGVVFFAFPPWRMPFGGHQQVSVSKWVSHFPYIHLLPKFLLHLFNVSQNDIEFLEDLKRTGISIARFDKILKAENYTVIKKTHWLINPNYETKFGLKPRMLPKLFQIPFLKDYYTSAMYYLIKKG